MMYKKDYYKPGAEYLGARVEFSAPLFKPNDYIKYLCKSLADGFFQAFETEFVKVCTERIKDKIRGKGIEAGEIHLTIPEKAIQDFLSVCELHVIDGKSRRSHDIDTKVY